MGPFLLQPNLKISERGGGHKRGDYHPILILKKKDLQSSGESEKKNQRIIHTPEVDGSVPQNRGANFLGRIKLEGETRRNDKRRNDKNGTLWGFAWLAGKKGVYTASGKRRKNILSRGVSRTGRRECRNPEPLRKKKEGIGQRSSFVWWDAGMERAPSDVQSECQTHLT